MLVAEICANLPAKNIDQTYTYAIPERLKFLTVGWRVIVPFGRQTIDGFVMRVRETDETFEFELKEIADAVDDEPWFTPEMRLLSRWLADFYLCPLAQSMTLFMPGGKSKKIRPKFERVIKLTGTFDEKFFAKAPSQLKLLKLLQERAEIPAAEIKNPSAIRALVEKNLVVVEERRILRDSYAAVKTEAKSLELTPEQASAIAAVKLSLEQKKFRGFLLHGVTGSGKTQVYIELAKITRQMGRRALILVPEIALTGQIVQSFKAHFSDVLVIHSKLSVAERSDTFHKIRSGEVGIVIGARSALFTPVSDVGLIVVDEEQENSYKQESPPYYHARIVAEEFARFHGAAIVFGSATPSLENYYRAQVGELEYLELPHRALNQPLPEVELADMRAELKAGNKSVLSTALKNLLSETFENHQQAIVLLNRRGYSTFVMCRDCGEVIKCPDCGKTMAYHADKKLHCHSCEIELEPPKICPACGSDRIKYFGTGTQKLEQFLKDELPEARILRMDRDSTARKFAHEEILAAFGRGEADILFGTQMVAKGHDLAGVTAVGILSADGILFFPDFRAAEQCFDLITQAAGRAGRADLPGKVIVQAYNSGADVIALACRQDFKTFAERELPKREFLFFPPFSRLVKLTFTSKDEARARSFAELIVNSFKQEVPPNSVARQEIFGPIPAAVANLRGEFRFSVLIKSLDLDAVRGFLRFHSLHKLPEVQIDFDPTTTN
ncbi:MAG: primosomal protein N' [Selenomonadaceae bacterium]|nr:primosomal protein N' [Selenomonadaceae bacterium]